MISAVVLTYNEEIIIGKCLEALNFVDEIIVFDSFSTDNTVAISETKGANVTQRAFDNYSNQRNEALKSVSKNTSWILMVDADEIVTSSLKCEILDIIKSNDAAELYRVRRKDMFQGKWLKYSSGYPTWFPRLFKNGEVQVEREINEEYVTNGKIGHLNEHLIHYPFNKGLNWWFQKHNRYSDMEAEKMIIEHSEILNLRLLFSNDPVERRKFFKRLSYRVPLRPQLVFFVFFFFRKGFLDGYSGYTFCRMRKIYETMIDIKFKLKQKQ
jgi:glycosyltransferase involved in cell wall biosynthesis